MLIGDLEYVESTQLVTMDSNLEVTAVFSDMPVIIIVPEPETDPEQTHPTNSAPPPQPAPVPISPPPTQHTLKVDR